MNHESLPLQGIRVLELGQIVAGPAAGLILAELGADVIKIEPPHSGDTGRNMPNRGSTFYFLNRNKRSLALDLRNEDGRRVFARLVERSDVVIENYGPGALERLGIGYSWAKSVNPRIIYCSIKGFLPGPKESRPFLDELAQMEGGLAYMTGPPGQPMRAGASIVDIGAATYGALAVLAALLERERSGVGRFITAGLYETVVFWVGQHVSRAQVLEGSDQPLPAVGMGMRMGWGVYQLFPTRDNHQVFIAITTNRHWRQFCEEFGLTDLLEDPSLSDNRKRVTQKERLAQRITELTKSMEANELCLRLERAGVPYATVNTPADLLEDAHLKERMLELKVPGMERLRVPSLPIIMSDLRYNVRTMPPRLGEHTVEILTWLGYHEREISRLLESGIIRSDGPMLNVDAAD